MKSLPIGICGSKPHLHLVIVRWSSDMQENDALNIN